MSIDYTLCPPDQTLAQLARIIATQGNDAARKTLSTQLAEHIFDQHCPLCWAVIETLQDHTEDRSGNN